MKKFIFNKKVYLSLIITILFLAISFSFSSVNAGQEDCLEKCQDDADYQRFKKEMATGSTTARYCMDASLYNCAVSRCGKTAEKKTYFKDNRDKELAKAKRAGRDCAIALAE